MCKSFYISMYDFQLEVEVTTNQVDTEILTIVMGTIREDMAE